MARSTRSAIFLLSLFVVAVANGDAGVDASGSAASSAWNGSSISVCVALVCVVFFMPLLFTVSNGFKWRSGRFFFGGNYYQALYAEHPWNEEEEDIVNEEEEDDGVADCVKQQQPLSFSEGPVCMHQQI